MWCQISEGSTLLRVFKNLVQRRMFGHKEGDSKKDEEEIAQQGGLSLIRFME